MALQTAVSRRISPLDSAVITVGSIHGGTGGNIIADEVVMTGILRTLDETTRGFALEQITNAVKNTAQAYGVEGRIDITPIYCSLINDNEVCDLVISTSSEVLGESQVLHKEFPKLQVEDFAYFAKERPSCYYELGCGNPAKECDIPQHNGKFKVDEDCLEVGLKLQVLNTLAVLRG